MTTYLFIYHSLIFSLCIRIAHITLPFLHDYQNLFCHIQADFNFDHLFNGCPRSHWSFATLISSLYHRACYFFLTFPDTFADQLKFRTLSKTYQDTYIYIYMSIYIYTCLYIYTDICVLSAKKSQLCTCPSARMTEMSLDRNSCVQVKFGSCVCVCVCLKSSVQAAKTKFRTCTYPSCKQVLLCNSRVQWCTLMYTICNSAYNYKIFHADYNHIYMGTFIDRTGALSWWKCHWPELKSAGLFPRNLFLNSLKKLNIVILTLTLWPINSGVLTSLLLPHLSSSLTDYLLSLNLLCRTKTDVQFMQGGPKAVWSIPYVSVVFFPSLKQNFIVYLSSSRPDCIFEIQQL